MLRIETKDFMREIAALEKKLEKLVEDKASPRVLNRVAEETARLIVKRTRLGFGVTEQGQKIRLKRLSDKYMEMRRRRRRFIDPTTSPGKSNLTFTGQMLRSVQARKDRVQIPSGRNEKVAGFVSMGGRPFFNISKQERSQLVRYFKNLVGGFDAKL